MGGRILAEHKFVALGPFSTLAQHAVPLSGSLGGRREQGSQEASWTVTSYDLNQVEEGTRHVLYHCP